MANIKLQSSDGQMFECMVETVKYSGTIKSMLEDGGMDELDEAVVPLPNVRAVMLRRVLQWIDHHQNKRKPVEIGGIPDADFLKYDLSTLFEMISVAKYLDIKDLLHRACKFVANIIKRKSPAAIRSIFNINNDLEPSDEMFVACEKTATVMKVPVDDWEDIFDYTSVHDLLSLAQTCKRMQKIVGWYLNTYIPKKSAWIHNQNVMIDGTAMTESREFVSNLWMPYVKQTDYQFIASNNFRSLKTIQLFHVTISLANTNAFKEVLTRIETVELNCCQIVGDFYEIFLKWCVNLRSLKISKKNDFLDDDFSNMDTIIGNSNNWMLQKYPTLENMEFQDFIPRMPTYQLSKFLKQNPNLKMMALNVECFSTNAKMLMYTKCNLDIFKVDTIYTLGTLHLDTLQTKLNALHEREFYKRLHLRMGNNIQDLAQVSSFRGLEAIDVIHSYSSVDVSSSSPINLKSVYLQVNGIDNMELFCKQLVKVQKLIINWDNFNEDHLQTILRHSATLREIDIRRGKVRILEIPLLNAERHKLQGARKVTILVCGHIYLVTKHKFGGEYFDLIDFKRRDKD